MASSAFDLQSSARQVTGAEILTSQFESAVWSASVLGHKNIGFTNTDVLLDLTIPQHDIVFLSEVRRPQDRQQ